MSGHEGNVLPLRRCTRPDAARVSAVARLRRARWTLGWSQERCADELGVGHRSVRRWESAQAAAPAWALVALEEWAAERKAA